MGTYDTLHHGDRYEQVKLWGKGLRYLHVGDRVGVPRGGLAPSGTYTVAMRSGGYVHVVDGILLGWRDRLGPAPVLTTGGERCASDDRPGAPRTADGSDEVACARRRSGLSLDGGCPRHGRPSLRIGGDDDPSSGLDRAQAAARADVAARLARCPDESARIRDARAFLADATGYALVACEAAATLLGLAENPASAGARLVRLLFETGPDGPEWANAARLLTRVAGRLPTGAVGDCLRLLADALPDAAPTSRPNDAPAADPAGMHPSFLRRRARIAAQEDPLDWLGRYGDLDFREAAGSAVAHHGAAVLPSVPLRFWGRTWSSTNSLHHCWNLYSGET